MHDSGKSCRGTAETRLIVIARLDRAIQYSGTAAMESKGGGVLVPRMCGV